MSVISAKSESVTLVSSATRWGQLVFGIICMVMIANLQYGWTLFVNPIDQKYHWGRAAIQVAFTIFVLTETWLVPIEGYLIDRFGPRVMLGVSGLLVAIAWVMNAYASSLTELYIAAAIGGIGAGVIYGGAVGNALKWFPDRRGLAAGLTAAGFGAGSALTVVPIANMIGSSGYEAAFFWFGIGQGVVVMLFSLFLRAPNAGEVAAMPVASVPQSRRDFGPAEVVRNRVFWVMYAMFVMVGAGGLMAVAQLGPIRRRTGPTHILLSRFGNHPQPQRPEHEQRQERGDDVEGGRDVEHRVPAAGQVGKDIGERNEQRGRALRGVEHAVVRGRIFLAVEIGAGRREERIDFAPGEEHHARQNHEQHRMIRGGD